MVIKSEDCVEVLLTCCVAFLLLSSSLLLYIVIHIQESGVVNMSIVSREAVADLLANTCAVLWFPVGKMVILISSLHACRASLYATYTSMS